MLKYNIVVFDEVYIYIYILISFYYDLWSCRIPSMERMNSRICKNLIIRMLFCRTEREIVFLCHNYCTKMITYFAGMYLVVELRDVSLHSCKLRLTVILVSTSGFWAFDHIHEAIAQHFCWLRTLWWTSVQIDAEMFRCCFYKVVTCRVTDQTAR